MNVRNTFLNTINTKTLLACGAIGCPFFIIVFLIEGATRADYNPLRYPISSLSIGATGWTQAANFLITGLLIIAFAIGLRRTLQPASIGSTWGPVLISLVGLGLVGAAFFTTDPVYGYPPTEPLMLAQISTHGRLHDLFSSLVFLGLPIACFVFTRRFVSQGERGWATYSVLTGIGFLAIFILAAMGFSQTPGFVEFGGLYQRFCITVGWVWITLLAIHFLRTSSAH